MMLLSWSILIKGLLQIIIVIIGFSDAQDGFCPINPQPSSSCGKPPEMTILYDVLGGEGFNLRRDVFMRMAAMILHLHKIGINATLVLPPFGPLPHWRQTKENMYLSWEHFFDVKSIQSAVPVIEYKNLINKQVDLVIQLEHFEDMFTTSVFTERHEWNDDCEEIGKSSTFQELSSKETKCLFLEGTSLTMADIISRELVHYSTILLSGGETILHSEYGSGQFWRIRKSMKMSQELVSRGKDFMRNVLRVNQNVLLIAFHLRRRDFAHLQRKEVPTIDCSVTQIKAIHQVMSLQEPTKDVKVFLATDATDEEVDKISQKLFPLKVFMFADDSLTDGQNAMVDQWICSQATLFVGTYSSTFSFRIQEEREILGFPTNSTFNALCGDCTSSDKYSSTSLYLESILCRQESVWKYKTAD